MPRQMRLSLPGAVWHITHRCHNKAFLLKGRRTRAMWIRWLFEAQRRYEICVLDYIVTRNHIHLLLLDRGRGEIAPALQLVAGRTGQAFNRRFERKGAFWETRFHSTMVASDEHFHRCLAYVDLNMVRAGVVAHPVDWLHSGFHEIQRPKQRYRIINHDALLSLVGVRDQASLAAWHRDLVAATLETDVATRRHAPWTDSPVVGDARFVAEMEKLLGVSPNAPGVSDVLIPYMTEKRLFRSAKVSKSRVLSRIILPTQTFIGV